MTDEQAGEVHRLFLSNNGSILNPATMPSDTLLEIIDLAHERFPSLEIVCLETRLDTVSEAWIVKLRHHLSDCHQRHRLASRQPTTPAVLQFSAGYETQDPYLRNAILWKGYSEDKVQDFFALTGASNGNRGSPFSSTNM